MRDASEGEAAAGAALPLAGIRVIDASSFIAGPAAAMVLGDWGADVIKVEPPGTGDPHRQSFESASYPKAAVNFPWQLDGRNKRSIALDLKHPAGRAAFDRLVARADVLVVNFPRPVRERLRLRWEDVRPLNPRLIYASLTGYGETGPEADTPGFDASAYFARSGIFDALRYEGQPPAFSLPAQGDRPSAMALVAAIMMGLYRRERTGEGGWVGTSLFANGVWSTATLAAGALVGALHEGHHPPRERPRNALVNQYRAKDGRWFILVLNRDRRWPAFCEAIGRPDLPMDPRFAESQTRRRNAALLVGELDAAFAAADWPHWQATLARIGVAAAPIGRLGDLERDEQALAAGIIVPTASPQVPRTIATPLRMGFAEPRPAGPAPALGEHTAEILREAGYDDAAIEALRRDGAAA
jgi:formyl-CoA transferase